MQKSWLGSGIEKRLSSLLLLSVAWRRLNSRFQHRVYTKCTLFDQLQVFASFRCLVPLKST